MKKNTKETIKNIFQIIPQIGGIILLMMVVFPFVMGEDSSFFISSNSEECSMSKYNTFTNTSGATRILGNCYVPITHTYTSKQHCGTFGISCYEGKERVKMYTEEVCFKLKTGELC